MAETLSDLDAVLSANLEFYRAFNDRNAKIMDTLWARGAPVLCVHPGWTALSGRDEVIKSWRSILANPNAPHVMCHDDRAFLYGDLAIVQCEEELDTGHLVATNMFVREAGAWKMIHHQASPIVVRSHEERRRRPSSTRH
ncbi:MAG TPA: nuclear transport factor 2 family protein [Stellaceae bacterium]|jgi:predicted nuclease with RNAse H fold|nr:nuclear transport factor 2 family protein [Stellaceae bacterium]